MLNKLTFLLSAWALAVTPMLAQHPKFALSDRGLVVEAGIAGRYTIEVPALHLEEGSEKPHFQVTDPNHAVAIYPSGARLEYTLKDDKTSFHLTHGPSNAKSFRFWMPISRKLSQGGDYAFDGGELLPLPMENSEQFLWHGSAQTFTLVDPTGLGFTLKTPGGYLALQDNKPKGWGQNFGFIYQYDTFGKEESWFSFELRSAEADASPESFAQAKSKVIVDRYGQSTRVDYPEKVTTDAELKADAQKDKAFFEAYQPPEGYDQYGGLAGTHEQYGLEKTGFFHVGQADGRDVLVTPEGNIFFQLAFCTLQSIDDYTTVKGREEIYEWLPPKTENWKSAWRHNNPENGVASFYIANWIRKFDRFYTLEEWSRQAVKRLRSWGFNSAGAFSADTQFMQEMNVPTVDFLSLNDGALPMLPDKLGAGRIIDPFAPGIEETLDRVIAKKVRPNVNNPRLIGYFLGNEQHVEDIPKLVPTYKASQVPAKAKLIEMLENEYGSIEKFNEAWNPAEPLSSFEEAGETPLFIRTDKAAADMRQYFRAYLETYATLVERIFRKHDPHHLLIGSRWTPATANVQDVVEITGPYVDVLSINYYTYAIDADFLQKVHRWSGGKPMILSEWHYCVNDQGLQARMEMANQKDRAKAYRNYVEQAAALPFVVGVQWFSYLDQSITGRFFQGFHGEGNAIGFVNVVDRPYEEMVAAAKKSNFRIYEVMMGREKPFHFDDPRFDPKATGGQSKVVQVPKALPGMELDGTTTNWPTRPAEPIPSSRTVIGLEDEGFSADYRLCWNEQNLYLQVSVKDSTPMKTEKTGDKLWSADGVEIFIGPKKLEATGKQLYSDRQILIGASEEHNVHVMDQASEDVSTSIETVVDKNVTGDGYTLQAAIPWSVVGMEPESGKEFLFDIMVDNSEDGQVRVAQLAWSGTKNNSKQREDWGRAVLSAN